MIKCKSLTDWHYAECRYADCHYAECHYAEYRCTEYRYTECRGAQQPHLGPSNSYWTLFRSSCLRCLKSTSAHLHLGMTQIAWTSRTDYRKSWANKQDKIY